MTHNHEVGSSSLPPTTILLHTASLCLIPLMIADQKTYLLGGTPNERWNIEQNALALS